MKKLIALSLLLLQMTGSCSFPEQENRKDVLQAYNLRMEGKSDQALALLDSLLQKDSTNALAHFERSRILSYMLLGGGNTSVDDIVGALQKAVVYDPGNAVYAYDLATASFLNAYIALSQGKDDAPSLVGKACDNFKNVLKISPVAPEAILQLVEIYGLLPPALGGDSLQALRYREELMTTDAYYAAKANLDFYSGDAVAFWNDYLTTHDTTSNVLRDIGYAYLYHEKPEKAEEMFRMAMKMDSSQQSLLLDMARYYMYTVMENRDLADSLLPIAAVFINEYLKRDPSPPKPMQAYALGMLVRTNMFTGHKEEAEATLERAKALDPWFSRASGLPNPELFIPPDKVAIHFISFFRPF